jgi:hypothetical protein
MGNPRDKDDDNEDNKLPPGQGQPRYPGQQQPEPEQQQKPGQQKPAEKKPEERPQR